MISPSEKKRQGADHAEFHRAGSAWTDRGRERLVARGPGDWSASVLCHRRAIELLGELPVDENTDYLADLGAAWVNLGCALQAGAARNCLEEALGAFDRAVELLERLPLGAVPRFRHNLGAAWMNRADACMQIGTTSSLTMARRAYARAIEIAGELPLDEKPSFRVLLASCWLNLGNLEQRLSRFPEAVLDYDRALAALGILPRCGHRLARHHAATAWTNRGEALLCIAGVGESAVESAKNALLQVEGRPLDSLAEAKLKLRALRVLARGRESLLCAEGSPKSAEQVAGLTDIAERALDLALGIRGRDSEMFDPFLLWFFSFGSRIYGRYQPQFLAEYLKEVLHRWNPGADPAMGAELRAVARQAAAGTLDGLRRKRLMVAGTRQTDLLLSAVSDLQNATAQFA